MAKILLIDDSPTVLMMVQKCLEKEHEVFAFPNWSEAMPTATTEKLDLALIDLNLRGFQGNDIVKFLRNMSTERIYLFSAEDPGKLKEIAKKCGADGYIQKVLLRTQLIFSINRALGTTSQIPPNFSTATTRMQALTKEQIEAHSNSSRISRTASSQTLVAFVNTVRELSKDDFVKQYPLPSLLQLNQYEDISTLADSRRTYTGGKSEQLARTDPKHSLLFFLKSKKGASVLQTVTVGRSMSADIHLDTPRVSHFHAYFRKDREGKWTIRDSRSTNGTFLNGRKLKTDDEAPLRQGSIVAFSEALRFKFLTPEDLFTRIRMYRSVFS